MHCCRPWHDQRRDAGRTRNTRPPLHPWCTRAHGQLVRELVLDNPAPFVPLVVSKTGKQVDYEGKGSAASRQALTSSAAIIRRRRRTRPIKSPFLSALQRQLARGDKALIGKFRLSPLPKGK